MTDETRSSRMRAAAVRRYPCAVLPNGAIAALAIEFGLTRQRVSFVLRQCGLMGTIGGKPPRQRYFCTCGREVSKKCVVQCLQCRKIDVACDGCGTLVKRSARRIIATTNRPDYVSPTTGEVFHHRGLTFCTKHCQGAWLARNFGFGTRRTTGVKLPLEMGYCDD